MTHKHMWKIPLQNIANHVQQYIKKVYIKTKWDLSQWYKAGSTFEYQLMQLITKTDYSG